MSLENFETNNKFHVTQGTCKMLLNIREGWCIFLETTLDEPMHVIGKDWPLETQTLFGPE